VEAVKQVFFHKTQNCSFPCGIAPNFAKPRTKIALLQTDFESISTASNALFGPAGCTCAVVLTRQLSSLRKADLI
jgi:hypothetical protein